MNFQLKPFDVTVQDSHYKGLGPFHGGLTFSVLSPLAGVVIINKWTLDRGIYQDSPVDS